MERRRYPAWGDDLRDCCKRLAQGLGASGAAIILNRGPKKEIEVGMSFASHLKVDSGTFRRLAEHILQGDHNGSLDKRNKACEMLAETANSEGVVIFVIHKDRLMRIYVSRPTSPEIVASYAVRVANEFDAMN